MVRASQSGRMGRVTSPTDAMTAHLLSPDAAYWTPETSYLCAWGVCLSLVGSSNLMIQLASSPQKSKLFPEAEKPNCGCRGRGWCFCEGFLNEEGLLEKGTLTLLSSLVKDLTVCGKGWR